MVNNRKIHRKTQKESTKTNWPLGKENMQKHTEYAKLKLNK